MMVFDLSTHRKENNISTKMASNRTDLEARLRALREPKSQIAPTPVQPAIPAPPAPTPPPVPALTIAANRSISAAPRPNFASFASPAKPTAPAPSPAVPAVDMAKLLGPEYENAVQRAQYAIECERRRLVHTAIDSYIGAGQALVAIGRRQSAPHLQTILKTKALALLQRAEGLEEWANRVITSDNAAHAQDDALRDAMSEAQQREQRDTDEKEALVAQMTSENNALEQKLNQLALLAKVQTRFRRIVSNRRARKAQETGEKTEAETDTTYQSEVATTSGDTRTRTGHAASAPTSASSSPREEQRRALVNELHARIGLPEISTWHTFKPLGESADHDQRRDRLEKELEDARLEAERLRAAVQDMEESLRAAADYSRERSQKLEKQKEDEVARLQSELERMKSALDLERRWSSKRMSGDSSSDPDAFENDEIIEKLRMSLRAFSDDEDDGDDDDDEDEPDDRRVSRVRRLSLDQSSPRHQPRTAPNARDAGATDDEDDGVWL